MSQKHAYKVADFRFELEGEIPVLPNLEPFLADGTGAPLLFRLELVKSLPLIPTTPFYTTDDGPGFPVITIDKYVNGGWRFRVQPLPGRPVAGEMSASEDFTRAQLLLTGADDAFAVNNSLMLLFAFSSARSGLLEMHASVVISEGKGYLFLGKSGTGKSTHSSLWLKHIPGTWLLNDDNPVLRLMPSGEVLVFGSPWSGKTPCYKALSAPAGAVVRLSQAPYNKITKLNGINAYASLMASASSFRPFSDLADYWHKTLEAMIGMVPCYHLECLPDQAAAELCYNTIHG